MRGVNPRALTTVALALCTTLTSAPKTLACSGPCATPEVWAVDAASTGLTVTTNFGLLVESDGAWQLVCEETTPGLFLQAQLSESARYVSTSMGLAHQAAPSCEFETLATAETDSAWLLDIALPQASPGTDLPLFGVRYNQGESLVQVVRGNASMPFEVVVSYDLNDGYDHVIAGGDPTSVFLTGYSFNPRVFRVAYSLDGGDLWKATLPEVDTTGVTFLPLAVNPGAPGQLLLHMRTATDEPDELWLFDAESEQMSHLFTLSGTAAVVGSATLGNDVFVAGAETSEGPESMGSLYSAAWDELAFEQRVEAGPGFSCLHSDGELLYTCTNNFTRESSFLVASSDDQGDSWTPLLQLETLADADTCNADACGVTLEWMHDTFGALKNDEATDSAVDAGADAGVSAPGDAGVDVERDTDDGRPANDAGKDDGPDRSVADAGSERKQPSSSGCTLLPSRRSASAQWAALLACLVVAWRRRAAAVEKKRWPWLAAACVAAACGGESDADQKKDESDSGHQDHDQLSDEELDELEGTASAADCAGRGDDLDGLEIDGEHDTLLRLIEADPAPPSVGNNSLTVEILADGELLSGIADDIHVTPHMPDHGHGTPVAVGIEELDDGQYRLSPVNTFMPGFWQITVEVSGELESSFQFGICVE